MTDTTARSTTFKIREDTVDLVEMEWLDNGVLSLNIGCSV